MRETAASRTRHSEEHRLHDRQIGEVHPAVGFEIGVHIRAGGEEYGFQECQITKVNPQVAVQVRVADIAVIIAVGITLI